jgi:hypothetical protein
VRGLHIGCLRATMPISPIILDQSLDDELGKTEYVRVLSERDCRLIKRNPDQPDYVPLYVKMHGTASDLRACASHVSPTIGLRNRSSM